MEYTNSEIVKYHEFRKQYNTISVIRTKTDVQIYELPVIILLARTQLDKDFSDKSLVAKFPPTDRGWNMALNFVEKL